MLQIITTDSDNKPIILGPSDSENFILKIAQKFWEMQPVAPAIREPELLTEKELCEKLAVSRQCLVIWRKKGKVPFIKIGSLVRYDLNKVIDALETGKKKGARS